MSSVPIPSLRADGVEIQPRSEAGTVHLVVTGTLESREPRIQFDPYWVALDAAVRQARIAKVVLDVRGLDYMNSSGILTLARWLMRVAAQPDYAITIEHDPAVTWQASNVPVLAKLAPHVVSVAPVKG